LRVGRSADVVGREIGSGMLPVADSVAVRCDGASAVVTGTGTSPFAVSAGDATGVFASVLLSIGQGFLKPGGALIASHAIR
jgi:hypothetical protein